VWRRPELFVLVFLVACRKDKPAVPDAAAPPVAIADASVDAGPLVVDEYAGTWFGKDKPTEYEDSFSQCEVGRAKTIGHTSVAFKVECVNGRKFAYKPSARRGALRYKGELRAYTLGRELGFLNVPPAFERTMRFEAFPRFLDAQGKALWAKEAIEVGGTVKGVAIPWIDKLVFPPFEKDPLLSQWKAWLKKDAAIPAEPVTLGTGATAKDPKDVARQLSDMIVFDYLTANWDRFSGANVGWRDDLQLVLYVDNDGAFFPQPPKEGLERNDRLLEGTDRFSKSLWRRLERFPKDDEAVMKRLDAVRASIRKKIDANGEAATLFFP